ncbi:DUF3987 domain-containing protein [Paracoccus sp. S-4012]|uniref:DUF3987 domain-containing protein n=1 Tax=Paracoccus sp. S-4012 TaxID=2665648 RepID=UPI0012B03613|nr:DUF3987 domain-containing protein [Paracoccus sp. S-4012]MRX50175.1 DUF3987 domain-containing protein [Paracoccus sp. S-4012]
MVQHTKPASFAETLIEQETVGSGQLLDDAQRIGWQKLQLLKSGDSCPIGFPVHALGNTGAAAAGAIHALTQAPMGICAQSTLGAMSAVSALSGDVETIMGSPMPLAVMLSTIALSGERKSTADDRATGGIRFFERKLGKQLAEEAEVLHSVPEPKSRKRRKEPEEPHRIAKIICSEPTVEGLISHMKNGPGTAFLANDDAAGFFGGHAMKPENRKKTISFFAHLFSGTPYGRPRANGAGDYIEGIPLAAHLMFQPYMLSSIYGDRELLEQGILPRILPAFPPSTMGTRYFAPPDPKDKATVEAFALRCVELLEFFGLARQTFVPGNDFLAHPRPVLRLSKDALEVLVEFYNEIESEIGNGGKYHRICSFASRATENATRLAGIGTLFDDETASEVCEAAARNGCELMRFYLASFEHITRVAGEGRHNAHAEELGRWLYGNLKPGQTAHHDNQVAQMGPAAFRNHAVRRAALDTLASSGWIRFLPPGTVVDGSPRQLAYELHPNLKTLI